MIDSRSSIVLFAIDVMLSHHHEGRIYLPVAANTLPAGFPSPAEDYVEQLISLDEELNIRRPSAFLVRVVGSDFQDVGIQDGDIIVVDRALTPKRGDFVVGIEDGKLVVERWRSPKQGWELWGTVTSAIRRFRHV